MKSTQELFEVQMLQHNSTHSKEKV